MPHSRPFIERQRRSLLKLRENVLEHLGMSKVKHEREIGDICDRGSADALAEINFTLSGMDSTTLREIDLALERINRGTYGLCETSGELIPAERLEALPFTRHTVAVAKMAERRIAPRPQYGIDPERFENVTAT